MAENKNPQPTFAEKLVEGELLKKEMIRKAIEFDKKLPEANVSDPSAANIRVVARSFLMASSQLARQIIDAAIREDLSLAIIGLRTLLEYEVNANYIFEHPKHLKDAVWMKNLCKDIFETTNDLDARKNRLGNIPLKIRFEETGRVELYKHNYSGLSDYAHLTLRQNLLLKRDILEEYSIDIICHSLVHIVSVFDAIGNHFELKWSDDPLREKIISYRDRFENSA